MKSIMLYFDYMNSEIMEIKLPMQLEKDGKVGTYQGGKEVTEG